MRLLPTKLDWNVWKPRLAYGGFTALADAAASRISGGQRQYLTTIAELALHQTERPMFWPARTFLPTQTTFLRRIAMLRNKKLRLERLSPFSRLIAVGIVFWIIKRLTTDFVVPLQFLRQSRCLDAWRELGGLARGNVGHLVLYFLFRIVLAIAIAVVVVAIVLGTCCVAGCLFAVPYLGTVLLLPILLFERAYSLHYLAQFGPDYDVFSTPATGVSATSPA